jgi:hypothetical protein
MRALFRDVDVIIAPATPVRAPRSDRRPLTLDGQTVPVRPISASSPSPSPSSACR